MHTIIKIAVVSVLSLFAIVGVVSISKAEVINLELQCDGKIDLIFGTFEGQTIWNSLMTEVDNTVVNRSERISITNNKLYGNFELQVDEDLIYLSDEGVKQINNRIKENIINKPIWSALSDYDYYVDIKFELDRYSGILTAKFELDSNEVIYHILNEFLYEGLAEVLPDISGFSFNAECKKLEEKLF